MNASLYSCRCGLSKGLIALTTIVLSGSGRNMTSRSNITEANITPLKRRLAAMQNYVFVIDKNKKPLHPIAPAKARKLLSQNKAAVFRLYPFTIVLLHEVTTFENTGYELKIDPGSKTTGLAIVNSKKSVIWIANLEHRGSQIKEKLQSRNASRRKRRNRKIRYRKPGLPNNKHPDGWLPPSLMHRVLTIRTWVNRLTKFCPITSIAVELAKFDTQKMSDPEISGVEYQQGELMGFEVREYLLQKWGRQCVYCGKGDRPLQVEHIVPKSKGGSNRVSNLTLACERCNLKKSDQPLEVFLKKKPELVRTLLAQAQAPLLDASAVNSTRWKLLECLKQLELPVVTGRGSQTKHNRFKNGLEKQHYIDAACVGDSGLGISMMTTQPLIITCKGTSTRQKCQTDLDGYPIRYNSLKPIKGWRNGDIAYCEGLGLGRVTPRQKGNFDFKGKGMKKPKSVKPSLLKQRFSHDAYAYGFG